MPETLAPAPLPPAHDKSRVMLRDVTEYSLETGTHLRRVCSMSMRLARALGLGRRELEAVRYGSLLHDIGKKFIPDEILHKPGRLAPAELHRIREHSALGADLARRSGCGEGVVSAILYHHERFDGHGYPDGLAGEEIPLSARIIAVVDTVDTIMHERTYDPPRTYAIARSELTDNAGSQFDPRVVGAYLEILEDVAVKREWLKEVA